MSLQALPTWKDLNQYTFDQFVVDFGVKYSTKEEFEIRRQIFTEELSRVQSHNAKNLSWKEGINKFSAMTAKEKKAFHGRSKKHAASQQLKHVKPLPESLQMKPISELPKSVDWREKRVHSSVKDQGHCGSCWAFASTAVIESHVAIATGRLFDLSVQQMAMCAPNPDSCGGTGGCAGSTPELAFDYVSNSRGMLEEYQYGYVSYYGTDYECAVPKLSQATAKINGFVKLPENNYTALMNAIATVGPIAISVDASVWHSYESGIFSGCNQASPDINHAVVLMGYGEEAGQKYWLVRNSWSANFGEIGYIRVARLDREEQACGVDTTPQDGSACAGETDPVTVCGTCGILYDTSYPLNAAVA